MTACSCECHDELGERRACIMCVLNHVQGEPDHHRIVAATWNGVFDLDVYERQMQAQTAKAQYVKWLKELLDDEVITQEEYDKKLRQYEEKP